MNVLNALHDMVQYLSEGVTRVFRPDDSEYPKTGVQPFEGEPFSQWVDSKNHRSS